MGSTRQHAVFGGDPALVFAAQEGREFFIHAGGAEDVGVAAADERRAFGVFVDTALNGDGAELVGATVACAHDDSLVLLAGGHYAARLLM
ncbi:hypothetical protein HMPREF9080_02937 [Cardiobacterium valvarum F0432]|uniref:Uncharacterized protein n=1 Tax=Cardiobacterium valvarum F0432 TaxID=797473 RepID=G9ZJG7_9GAMM|nr:hypothetical protein HMPREF9080_02937 [Cardiobacterium valvarum F0432]